MPYQGRGPHQRMCESYHKLFIIKENKYQKRRKPKRIKKENSDKKEVKNLMQSMDLVGESLISWT